MMVKRLLCVVSLLAVITLLVPLSASAQAVYGSIVGAVTDSSGAALPNAKVTVTDVGKGTRVEAKSNDAGNYTVVHLIPGSYNVRVEASGFKAYETKGIPVFADQTQRVDARLEVGATATEVTVTGEAVPLLKEDRADVATTFTAAQVTELPNLNRNFTDFQLLTPGTQKLTWQHAASENPQQSTQIFIDGQHFSGTAFQLDGTDNRDPILGIIVINPNLDSVTEAKVATQAYDAEFGQAITAVITTQTKSGTNSLHGSAFWFRKNDELQARDPFTESTKNALTGKFKPDALWNQFGGTLGGPIIKNKWFIFGDYQGQRSKVGRTVKTTVPTNLIRSTCLNPSSAICDFSEYLAAGFQLYNPNTGNPVGAGRTPFAGNIIPKSLLSPAAIKLLSLLPAPNTTSTVPFKDNFVKGGTGGFNNNGFDVRSDFNWTQKLHLLGRYSLQKFTLSGAGIFDTPQVAVGGAGLGLNGFGGLSSYQQQSLASGFDYTLSNSWFADFRFGWFKYSGTVNPNGVGTKPADDAGARGLNTISGLNEGNFTTGMPAFFINGGGNTGDMAFGYALADRLTRCNCPLVQNEDGFQFVTNWSKFLGNHNFKFGGDVRFLRNLRVPSDQHRAGELSFTNGGTGLPGVGNSGAALASLLLGWAHDIHRYASTSVNAGERQKRFFFYGQDTWRATHKLTVNYGLRWEIYKPETATSTRGGGLLNLNTGQVEVAGANGVGSNLNIGTSYTNFAPRLGLAYALTDKTVIRAGYGRSYDIGVFGSTFGHTITQNLPVLTVQQINAANDFASAFNLDTGPAAPAFPAVPANLPDGIFQRARPRRMTLPTVDAWNLTVQRSLSPTLSLEVAYVGNKGTHVFAGNGPAFNVNQATIVGFTPGRNTNAAKLFYHRYPFQTVDAAGNCTTPKEPVSGNQYCWTQGIDFFGNQANNNYNALQTKLEKRFSKGLSFLAHYTWGQAFNYSDDYFPIDPHVNYGPNDFNRRQVLVFAGTFQLPFGRGRSYLNNIARAADLIIGGWELSTGLNISSGLPFTPSYSNCGADRDTGPCRPDKNGSFSVGASSLNPVTHVVQYFTPVPTLTANGQTAGAWRRPAVGTFGNVGRNSLRGPGYWSDDLSLFKNFSISERVKAQFRAEAYNAFNHRNNGTPGVFWSEFGGGGGNCIDCADGGQIKSLGGAMRQFQFGLKLSF